MKICPTCQTRYTDDTLQFCLQDGATLLSAEDGPAAPTVAFNDEQETVVKSRPTDRINFDLQNSKETQNRQRPETTAGPASYQNAPPPSRRSNTALIVITTALVTLLIAGIGTAAWIYLRNKKETARDANVKNSFPENASRNKTENTNVFASPSPDEKPTVKPTATPAPDFDPEQVKDAVSDTVDSWVEQAEARDLSSYMSNYAETVDYYNKRGATVATVRADKQKAFSTFDVIEINISNLRVTPDASGEKATAVFDKEWHFENDERVSEGKVQTQLQLRKIGGAWKITGERDLKVYYTN